MFVRVARFEGGDAAGMDEEMANVREQLANAEGMPEGLRSVKRVLTLIDRKGGKGLDLTFCETEDDLRAADEALNSMSPSSATSGKRTSVEMYEVAIDQTMG